MLYLYLKWLHVLSAIIAVGANATYGIWLARASRDPDHLPFALKSIKLLDDRVANPAYGLLLLTGLGMVITLPIPLTTPWLLVSLVLYGVLVVAGLLGYTPALRGRSGSWKAKELIPLLTRRRHAAGRSSRSSLLFLRS